MNDVRKGDRYSWNPHSTLDNLDIEVLRVSKTGAWADIQVHAPHGSWTKRQRLPFPPSFEKYWSVS